MIRGSVKNVVRAAVSNDRVWALLDRTVLQATRYAEQVREMRRPRQWTSYPVVRAFLAALLSDFTVRHGPFRGLRYPTVLYERSASSRSGGGLLGGSLLLVPKLLGSYERELHPFLEEICARPYTEIVNIGSAEGYYAMGLARRLPTVTVFAFDTDRDATQLCAEMAQLNGVASRVRQGAFCDVGVLKGLPLTDKALIICDCEGYEKTLFTEDAVACLARHDLLVEAHDFIDIEISAFLRQRFGRTHHIRTVRSVDDITKAYSYEYPELEGYDLASRRWLLSEYRPTTMQWFYMTARVPESRVGDLATAQPGG